MKVKLHLEVVEPDFIFFWVAVEFVWCFHYKGRSDRFPSFRQFVSPKFRPPDLRAEKIFFQTVFNSVNFSTRTVCSVILKSKLAREHIEPSLQTVLSFGCKMWSGRTYSNEAHHMAIYCPKGILCGRRLKTCVRKSVTRRRRRTYFWKFSHYVEAPVTRFLGGTVKASAKSWNLGIVHFFHLPEGVYHMMCQKHTFWHQKSTTSKWSIFRKLLIFGSVL